MTDNEAYILKQLTEILNSAGVLQIPDANVLLSRISIKLKREKLRSDEQKNTGLLSEIDRFSFVCFTNSPEVRREYLSEEAFLLQIDGYIDQLILIEDL